MLVKGARRLTAILGENESPTDSAGCLEFYWFWSSQSLG